MCNRLMNEEWYNYEQAKHAMEK